MGKIMTLAKREMASYFYSPMAYVIAALFLVLGGVLFFWGLPLLNMPPAFTVGGESSLRQLFENIAYLMVFVGPLLTMRLVSDEYRSGTIETLLTAPLTDVHVVLGKFLGVMLFYAVLLATTAVFLALVVIYGEPDVGIAAMGYLGMLLLGATYLSVGLFTSTMTRHQILAALVAVAILALFGMGFQGLRDLPDPWGSAILRLNVMSYFKDFARGVFDTRGLIFFLSATGLFLFLSVKTLESRRWR